APRRPSRLALAAGGLLVVAVLALLVVVLGDDDDRGTRPLAAPSAPTVALARAPDGWPRTLPVGLADDPEPVGDAPAPELRYRGYELDRPASDSIAGVARAGALPAYSFHEL